MQIKDKVHQRFGALKTKFEKMKNAHKKKLKIEEEKDDNSNKTELKK